MISKRIILEVPSESVIQKTGNCGEYYLVKIPCTKEHSSNEEMSFVANTYNVKDAGNGNYVVDLGEIRKDHNRKVYYKNDGWRRNTMMTGVQIENILKEGISEHPEKYNRDVRNQSHAKEEIFETLPYVDEVLQARYGLQFVENQTPEFCLASVKKDGLSLEFVKEQTPELRMEAVKNDGMALEFVEEQTLEICMEAIKQNSYALKFVSNSDLLLEIKERLEKTQEDLELLSKVNDEIKSIENHFEEDYENEHDYEM